MKRGSLRGRVEALEQQAVIASQVGVQNMTGEQFAEWVEATTTEYLERGYLVRTPDGLALGDIPASLDHEQAIASFLTALPELLRARGLLE